MAADGSIVDLDILQSPLRDEQGNVTHVIEAMRDVTERKLAEQESQRLQWQLAQTQKMEAVGQLAGGIAHDFNNLLTVISGNIEMVREALERPGSLSHAEMLESISIVEDSAKRAGNLTRQLLTFSRQENVEPTLLDLNQLLGHVEGMLRRLLRENIDLQIVYGHSLWSVLADARQIEQILLNLTANARDAMPDRGRLTIETANVTMTQNQPISRMTLHGQKQFVLLVVADTGCGMDEATCSRIFEPFFTTKPVGRGTGIGLATVYGIVNQLGGGIEVESAVDIGTTFRVYLPAADLMPDANESRQLPAEVARGQETVLLCEDNASVLHLAQRALQERGYTVLATQDAERALVTVAAHDGEIDLLLTDVILPGMNGHQLADRLQAVRPGLPVLYMSGYTADVLDTQGVPQKGSRLLEKPFTVEGLARRVRTVLDEGSPVSQQES